MTQVKPELTILTITCGRPASLPRLIESIENQTLKIPFVHYLFWDDFRVNGASAPESYNEPGKRFSIVLPPGTAKPETFDFSIGPATQSAGMMLAKSPWVTFADDDVWWEPNHLELMGRAIKSAASNWGSTFRTIWASDGARIGVDRFESVGDDSTRGVPYEMCDCNTMMFRRELGVPCAAAIRPTQTYDNDRLMYLYFKQYGGKRARVETPTINHICPDRLTTFFRANCSPA